MANRFSNDRPETTENTEKMIQNEIKQDNEKRRETFKLRE